jgi:hypothetical protein
MSNDQPARRPPAKSSGGGAPMGSTISIVIAVVAVVVGFIILRNINDTGDAGSPSIPDITSPAETADSSSTSSIPPTETTAFVGTPTTVPLTTTDLVIVANASGTKGAAAFATTALQAVGFTTAEPTNAFGAEKIIATTKVYYVAGAEATAASVAQVLSSATSVIATAPIPALIPVTGAKIGDAKVLVMIGTDLANKPLPAIAAATPAGQDATTVPTTATTVP